MKNVNYIFLLLLSLVVIKIDKINAQNTGCPQLLYVTSSPVCQGQTVEMYAYGYGATITGHKWYTSPSKNSFVNCDILPNSGYDYMTRVTASSPVTYYVANVCGSSESPLLEVTASFTVPVTPFIYISSSSISGSNGPEPYINTCSGTSVTFTSNTSQSGTYQWCRNGLAIPGANSSSYTTSTFSDNDLITVELSNITGTCLTSRSVSSEGIRIRVESFVSPSVKIQAPTSACSNEGVSFTAQPTYGGNYPIYRWSLDNGSPVSTGSGSVFSPGKLSAGSHTVKVEMESSQRCVSADSKKVYYTTSINVNQLQEFTPEMYGESEICPGISTGFYIMPNNGMSFAWTKNGVSLEELEGSSWLQVFEEGGVKDGDIIACRVTKSGASCIAPVDVTLSKTIKEIQIHWPQIEIRPEDSYICESRPVTFRTYSEDAFSEYSWSISGGGISGLGTGSTFSTLFHKGSVVSVTAKAATTGRCVTTQTAYASFDGSNYPIISSPSIIKTTPSYRCGTGEVTLNAQASSGNVVWYSALTDGNTLNYGSSYTPIVSSTSTYYVGAEENGCRSASRTAITATVNNITTPTITGLDNSSVGINCIYTTESGMSGYTWTASGGTIMSEAGSNEISVTWGPAGKGNVSVNYTNGSGCKVETATTKEVTIYPLPEINQQPLDVSRRIGNSASFSVTASGTDLTYQWKKNRDDIPGATSASYTIPNIKASDAGLYSVKISGAGKGSVTSQRAKLDVTFQKPTDKNCVITRTVQKESVTVEDAVPLLSEEEMQESITYYDGLGRPVQKVVWRGSPSKKDIIQPIAYDEFGRESVKYLPYVDLDNEALYRENALNETYSSSDHYKFYANGFINAITGDNLTYNQPLDKETNIIASSSVVLNPGFSSNGHNMCIKIGSSISSGTVDETIKPFAVSVFDASPLNRILEQGAPGEDWQPSDNSGSSNAHTTKIEYSTNAQSDVLLLTVNETGQLINDKGEEDQGKYFYYANELIKTIVKNENWDSESGKKFTTEEFKNKSGQVVLKRTYTDDETAVETYYVYDDLDLLRYVISPEAVNKLTFPADKSNTIIQQLCYYYEYDDRQRMTEKQVPGAKPVYMVYDKRNRLVLIQDGKMRAEDSKKWLFTKYDAFNRPVLNGEYTHTSALDQAAMQTVVNNFYTGDKPYFEEVGTQIHGYTNQSFPNVTDENAYLTGTYYDNYNTVNTWGSDYVYSSGNTGIKGQVTGTKTKVLGTNIWLKTAIYYDNKYRIVQSRRDLYDGSNSGNDMVSTVYDFVGKVLQVHQEQTFNGNTTAIDKNMVYDHAGRLLKTEQQIIGDANSKVTLASNTYNELGQLKTKQIGGNAQTVDYKYNLRGWLTQINDPASLGSDLFSMKLLYNNSDAISGLTAAHQYNGNISGMIVNRKDDSGTSSTTYGYGFTYDALNRLTESDYGEGDGFTTNADKYNEFGIKYDANGNILNLQRNSGSLIDNLKYTYKNGGNQLESVTDESASASGFNDVIGTDYDYDANGNLIKENNKGIASITYNLLNLPNVVSKDASNNIKYVYDATGAKLCKETTEKGTTTKRWYCGSMEYDNSKALSMIHTDEGMVEVTTSGTNRTYNYAYYLKDHLGNTRAVFNKDGNLLQRTDYYPYGMTSNTYSSSTDNKYLYNGKELQQDLALNWYDYGARFYDAQIGRWSIPEPLTDLIPGISPYAYAYDNPINNIDEYGMWPDWKRIINSIGHALNNALGSITGGRFYHTHGSHYAYHKDPGKHSIWSPRVSSSNAPPYIPSLEVSTYDPEIESVDLHFETPSINLKPFDIEKINGKRNVIDREVPGKITQESDNIFDIQSAGFYGDKKPQIVKHIAKILISNPNIYVTITAKTDLHKKSPLMDGEPSQKYGSPQILCNQRGRAIYDALKDLGVNDVQIKVIIFDESQTSASKVVEFDFGKK